MFDFHEKRKIRRFLYSKIVIAGLFLVALCMSFSVHGRYIVAQDMKARLEAKRAELERMKERANVIQSKVQYMEDDRGIEEELRNRFDVAKAGEQVVILVDPKDGGQKMGTTSSSSDSIDKNKKQSFWDLFKFW